MKYFDPFAAPFWSTVGMAVLCGAIVGLERQLRGKPAGIRTSILICLSTTVFIHLGAVATEGTADATRVLGQIVTGRQLGPLHRRYSLDPAPELAASG